MLRFISLLLLASSLWANDVYISQAGAGGNTGANCANALPDSYFNNAANWVVSSPTGTQIGPATTVHICGTFTVASGVNELSFQGSGTSGNPVTLFFENGANFTTPVMAFGVISTNGNSFITINGNSAAGGLTGVITSTANGTTLANQNSTVAAISATGSNNTVENLVLGPIYTYKSFTPTGITLGAAITTTPAPGTIETITVSTSTGVGVGWQGVPTDANEILAVTAVVDGTHLSVKRGANKYTGGASTVSTHVNGTPITWVDGNGGNTAGVYNSGGNNFTVSGNIIHDAHWCIEAIYNNHSNWNFFNNTIYNCDHGPSIGGNSTATQTLTGLNVYNNTIHDFSNWDSQVGNNGVACASSVTLVNVFHHDGIHIWADGSGNTVTGNVYNNYIYGQPGCGLTSLIFEETQSTGHLNLNTFNNILIDGGTGGHLGTGYIGQSRTSTTTTLITGLIANNTIIGPSNYNATSVGIGIATDSVGVYIYNNIMLNMHEYTFLRNSNGTAAWNYNDYHNQFGTCTSYTTTGCGIWDNQTRFSQWQAFGDDLNSLGQSNAVPSNPNLICASSSCYVGGPTSIYMLTAGSPAIGAGTNLTSAWCGTTPAVCLDLGGNPRPTSGAWDVGAFQYISPAGSVWNGTIKGVFQ